MVKPSQHSQQYPALYPLDETEDGCNRDAVEDFLQIKKRVVQQFRERQSAVAMTPSAKKRREKPRASHEICVIGPNDMIGKIWTQRSGAFCPIQLETVVGDILAACAFFSAIHHR